MKEVIELVHSHWREEQITMGQQYVTEWQSCYAEVEYQSYYCYDIRVLIGFSGRLVDMYYA